VGQVAPHARAQDLEAFGGDGVDVRGPFHHRDIFGVELVAVVGQQMALEGSEEQRPVVGVHLLDTVVPAEMDVFDFCALTAERVGAALEIARHIGVYRVEAQIGAARDLQAVYSGVPVEWDGLFG